MYVRVLNVLVNTDRIELVGIDEDEPDTLIFISSSGKEQPVVLDSPEEAHAELDRIWATLNVPAIHELPV